MYQFINNAKKFFLGQQGGLIKSELNDLVYRKKFSDFLPWHDFLAFSAFDETNHIYINTDNTIGLAWRCQPRYFADSGTIETLEGIFRLDIPDGSVLQFILHGDPNIEHIIANFQKGRVRNDSMSKRTIREFSDHMRKCAKNSNYSSTGSPFRDFNLYITLKIPDSALDKEGIKNLIGSFAEILSGAKLSPEMWDAPQLLAWARRLLNVETPDNIDYWNVENVLRRQVIFAHTDIQKYYKKIVLGEKDDDGNWVHGKSRYFKCITPKDPPYYKDNIPDDDWYNHCILMTNRLFGGMWGMSNDIDQIRTPFLYCLNIVFDKKIKSKLEFKCGVIQKQHRIGSWAKIISERQSEFSDASTELKRNTKFLSVIPIMWVYDDNEQSVNDSINKVKRLWESEGWIMQKDVGILPILFLSSLPFGLRNIGKNIENLDRDFIFSSKQIAPILPVQGDFIGNGKYIFPLVGRKGQLGGIDLFHGLANNHNGIVSGGMGAGKSVMMNCLTDMYYSMGSLLRIVEIGRSYKRTVKILKGRHIEFDRDADICLNPFTHINAEDFVEDIPSIASVICQMIFSSTGKIPEGRNTETVMTLIKNAIKWAWANEGNEATPSLVGRFLKEYPDHEISISDMHVRAQEDVAVLAHTAAYNLRDFVDDGVYAKWFNGKSTLNFASDELVCLELEGIRRQIDLYNVVTLQVMNEMSMDLYLSDRSRQRILIFEEVAEYLRDNKLIESVIDALYRRARKYKGSALVVMQSLMFLKHFGRVGDIIWNNSEFKFYLQSDDYHAAQEKGILDLNPFVMKLLKTVQTKKGSYGEFAVQTPHMFGVGRLALPPFAYYKYTSDATDTAKIDALVAGGMNYEEAIDEMVRLNSSSA
jgi:conjugal transfer ATP-binding protein TraC